MTLEFNNKNELKWDLSSKEQIIENVCNLINLTFNDLPINRQIGVSRDFMYQNVSLAQLKLYKEIERNIKNYEPRAKINSIYFKKIDINGGLELVLDVDFKEV